jgi:NH3-dependent NAD+ synthetase
VIGVAMPGPYSSPGSIEDARTLAGNLKIRFEILPITEIFIAYRYVLKPVFDAMPEDATEENLQSRARGMLLMALSNKFGGIVLSTGNKSEMAVGYCHYVNSRRVVIPQATMEKPPSAELRPNQFDSDSLPPYDVLDAILEDYVEDLHPAEQIARERGFDIALVRRVVRMVERSEYKRQQAAPGLKVSAKAFGYGRRFPIAAKPEL